MNTILRDLIIGIVGSVVGALIVLLSTSGLRFTKEASKRATARKDAERTRWHNGTPMDRQEITNDYLFGILKNMLIGNLLWALPSVTLPMANIAALDNASPTMNAVFAAGAGLGAIFFYRGIGLIINYMSLRRNG